MAKIFKHKKLMEKIYSLGACTDQVNGFGKFLKCFVQKYIFLPLLKKGQNSVFAGFSKIHFLAKNLMIFKSSDLRITDSL